MNNFKRVLAVLLAGTMVVSSSMVAFADDATTQSQDGAGTYEGDKMDYPTFSLSLPTITSGTYAYIADPNGNIAATSGARASGYTFEGNTGVYFLTDATGKKYTATSGNYAITNQNARDIVVTAEVKVKTAAANVVPSKTTDFSGETEKTANSLYLAIENAAKTKVAPLESFAADKTASVSMVVRGKKDNYQATYTASPASGHKKYEYALKTGDLSWNTVNFNLTGALNQKVSWDETASGKTYTFPEVTVTYKYEQVPVMTGDSANGYTYTWASSSKPSGTILALTVDGTERPAVVSGGKVKYNATDGKFTIEAAPVATLGLGTGDHTIVVKIGTAASGATPESAVEYTLNIEN